jgi:hypothetical protein
LVKIQAVARSKVSRTKWIKKTTQELNTQVGKEGEKLKKEPKKGQTRAWTSETQGT